MVNNKKQIMTRSVIHQIVVVSVLVQITVAVTEPTSSSVRDVRRQSSSGSVEKGRELAYHNGLVPIRGPRKKKLGDGVGTSSKKEQTKIGMKRGGGAKGRLYYT